MRFTSIAAFKCQQLLLLILFSLILSTSDGQVTFLDEYKPTYRALRTGIFKFVGPSDTDWSYKWNLKRGKVQKPFPESQKFFCDPNGPGQRSETVPISVHKLRPGDIDIIGALGDSLTAGNGALATNTLQIIIENKGVSWSIGGQENWRKYFTLPNIIKVFNPKLYGYSLKDGYSVDKSSRFNTAEIGAMSRDVPYEAKVLVKRMIADPKVNIKKHWKLITILIGPNDFCVDFCFTEEPEKTIKLHEINLINTLRVLRDYLPRTFVNLVTPPNLKLIAELVGKPLECETTHHFECPCLFSLVHRSKRKRYYKIIEQWQEVTKKVANLKEFNDREDFTVVVQPFLGNVSFPRLASGKNDFTYMSLDCFHLSQKGYARATNALWNNMLEVEGNKTSNWGMEFKNVKCPTEERPYFSTKMNS